MFEGVKDKANSVADKLTWSFGKAPTTELKDDSSISLLDASFRIPNFVLKVRTS